MASKITTDGRRGTDDVNIIVAGQLPLATHNAPLHLFSASPELVGFGRNTYGQRSETTSMLLGQLFESFQGENVGMSYTMEDFKRDYVKEHFTQLTPEERRQLLRKLPADERLVDLSPKQIRQYLDQLTSEKPAEPRKRRRKTK